MEIGDIFGWVGLILLTIYYLSPIKEFYRLIETKISYKDFPGEFLLILFFNCILWGVYSLREDLTQIWISNFLGCLINIIFIIIYLIFLGKEKIHLSLIYNFILIVFYILIFYILYSIFKNIYVGIAAIIFNILLSGLKIYLIYKKQNNIFPVISSIYNFIFSMSWTIYAFYRRDTFLIINNTLGVVFSILEIVVRRIFHKNSTIKKSDDNKEINNENQNVNIALVKI